MRNEFRPSERRLRLTLCDPRDHARELPVHYRIFDLPIARRWSDLVVFLSQNNSYLYDPERFYNFPGDPKADKSWVHAELEWCISRINRFVPGHVDVRPSADMDQDVLNELHERFADGLEDLVDVDAIEAMKRSDRPLASYSDLVRDDESWQRFVADVREHAGLEAGEHSFRRVFAALTGHPRFGEVAWTFYLAFNPVGAPLERLNKAIHRWEDVCAVRQHETQSGHEGWKYMCVNFFPFACIHMQDEDFRHFTIEDRFGRVYLDDMTAGKCIWDVYRDRDEHIVAEHYKSLGYYWGDFRIYMGPTHEASWTEQRMAKFWEWFAENEAMLAERGFRRDDPRLTIGSLPVADLEPAGVLAGLDPTGLVEVMSRYQRVKRVEIVDDADRPLTSSRFSASQGGWDQVLCTFGETAGAAGVYAG